MLESTNGETEEEGTSSVNTAGGRETNVLDVRRPIHTPNYVHLPALVDRDLKFIVEGEIRDGDWRGGSVLPFRSSLCSQVLRVLWGCGHRCVLLPFSLRQRLKSCRALLRMPSAPFGAGLV